MSRNVVVCEICLDLKTESEIFRSVKHCYHSFCLDCIGYYVADKLGQNIIHIRCPDPGCTGLLEPQNCRTAVAERLLNQWEAALSNDKNTNCPFRDCSAPLVVSGGDGDQLVAAAECPQCHRPFCRRCRVAWHGGCKCKSTNKRKRSTKGKNIGRKHYDKCMDRKFKSHVKKEKLKRCPGCKFYVEKRDGCEHIRCRLSVFTNNYFCMLFNFSLLLLTIKQILLV